MTRTQSLIALANALQAFDVHPADFNVFAGGFQLAFDGDDFADTDAEYLVYMTESELPYAVVDHSFELTDDGWLVFTAWLA